MKLLPLVCGYVTMCVLVHVDVQVMSSVQVHPCPSVLNTKVSSFLGGFRIEGFHS